jgi:hypothetical protein
MSKEQAKVVAEHLNQYNTILSTQAKPTKERGYELCNPYKNSFL